MYRDLTRDNVVFNATNYTAPAWVQRQHQRDLQEWQLFCERHQLFLVVAYDNIRPSSRLLFHHISGAWLEIRLGGTWFALDDLRNAWSTAGYLTAETPVLNQLLKKVFS